MNLWFRKTVFKKRTGKVFLSITGFIPVLCLGGNLLDYAMRDQTQSDGFHAIYNNDPALLGDYVGGILGYDYTDQYGFTLLMRASQSGARKNVIYLLDRGADRSIRNREGKTAYDLAREVEKRTWTNQREDYRQILSLLRS